VRPVAPAVIACAALGFAGAAHAHGVGERYDLPVPLGYYVVGAGLVIVLTFAVAAAFPARLFRHGPATARSWPVPTILVATLRLVAVLLLCLAVATGLLGDPHPARNFAPTFLWIIWWCGYSLFAALVADLWPALNPWRVVFDRVAGAGNQPRAYPGGLGEWPAAAQLLLFAWFEIVSPWASDPSAIAMLALVYSITCWAGMMRFGADQWLDRADPFALVFRTLGRFAPLHLIRSDGARWRLGLRWPGAGLLDARGADASTVAFVMVMLSTVLFDGFLGTSLWRSWDRLVSSFLPRGMDREGYIAATLGLLGIWLGFLIAYQATAWIMGLLTRGLRSGAEHAQAFCFTLVPIAIGYNLAHNFSYIVVQGQTILALASDPFGRGWNLFDTATFRPDIGLVGAGVTWTVAVSAIVVGHMVGVILAHLVALRSLGGRTQAVRALAPMTLLMVLYTMASLSILAEPIVRYRVPDPGYTRLESPGPAPPAAVARPGIEC